MKKRMVAMFTAIAVAIGVCAFTGGYGAHVMADAPDVIEETIEDTVEEQEDEIITEQEEGQDENALPDEMADGYADVMMLSEGVMLLEEEIGQGEIKNVVIDGDDVITQAMVTEALSAAGIRDGDMYAVTFSGNVTEIGFRAFYQCSGLESIKIPDSVITIGVSSFAYCESLNEIAIPNGVKDISQTTFWNCEALESIIIPNDVKSIGEMAFNNCTVLKSFDIPGSVTYIGSGAFGGCSKLKRINIPDGITRIGEYTFSGCTSLESVNIPSSVTTIDKGAFQVCIALANIEILADVTTIGAGAFENCTKLEEFIMPVKNNATTTGAIITNSAMMFKGCSSLKNVVLSNTFGVINGDTFEGCTSLGSIYIPRSVFMIDDTAFNDNKANLRIFGEWDSYAAWWAVTNNIAVTTQHDGNLEVTNPPEIYKKLPYEFAVKSHIPQNEGLVFSITEGSLPTGLTLVKETTNDYVAGTIYGVVTDTSGFTGGECMFTLKADVQPI